MEWSADQETRLRQLWQDETLSTSAIGQRLGFSKSAVHGKVLRMGLPPRESPIKPTLKRKPPKALRRGAVTLPPLASLS
jgi:hypothetical protein